MPDRSERRHEAQEASAVTQEDQAPPAPAGEGADAAPSGSPADAGPAHGGVEPYGELLRNVPDDLVDVLKEAADAEAATAWLNDGTSPDPDCDGGVDRRRRHLERLGTEADGTRWVDWHGNRYRNEADELEEFGVNTTSEMGPPGFGAELEDQLPCRVALANILVLGPEPADEDSREPTIPAESVVAVIEYARADGSYSYQGIYRLSKGCGLHEKAMTAPGARLWLNATAERLLARVLR